MYVSEKHSSLFNGLMFFLLGIFLSLTANFWVSVTILSNQEHYTKYSEVYSYFSFSFIMILIITIIGLMFWTYRQIKIHDTDMRLLYG